MTAAITLLEAEDPAFEDVLHEGLSAVNEPVAGPHGYLPLNLVVRRPGEAAPAGGLSGYSFHRWLFIHLFYLPADLRQQGLGTLLLQRAETEARARGCIGIHLDTFSFQARPFYERHGFTVFGTIEDFPIGHRRHFLSKRLDRESTHVPA